MTWNSGCSIASDDDSSRHSFLSDCDSEFDLRPPPRYPAEKRSYSTLNKQLSNRLEPPLTRSRAKAIGQTMITSEPLPKQRRQSALRRSIDAFTGMASTLTNGLNNNNSILFPKQESSTPSNDRPVNTPLDGVNILADRFEGCSLDEGKLNKNCVWPSFETNSHYTRLIPSSTRTNTFDGSSFSTFNHTPLFAQSSIPTPTLFGQQQAQLWSRFRFAASTLRNDLWIEQTETNLQQVPSNIFTSNYNHHNSFQYPMFTPSQTVPTRLLPSPSSSLNEETSSSSLLKQRKISPTSDPIPSISSPKEDFFIQQSSISRLFFTFTIFAFGLILGCILTNILPIGLIWKTFANYFHIFYIYLQTVIKYFTTF